MARRARARYAWELAAASAPAFDPRDIGKIKRWYRLAASAAVAAEWETVVDVLGGVALAQTDADRKPAVAAAANGLPVAAFDGTDMWLMSLDAAGTGGNNGTAEWEIDLYFKVADLGAGQRLFAVDTASGANLNRIRLTVNTSGGIDILVFITNADGRNYSTPNSIVAAGAFAHLRFAYVAAGATEVTATPAATDKVRVWVGGTAQGLTPSDVGAGGTVGALRSAAGTGIVGAANDSDTPASPLRNGGQTGPNVTIADAVLTDTEATNLRAFEVPT